MRFDSSYEDGKIYRVTDVKKVENHIMSKALVIDFVGKELSGTLNCILNADDGHEAIANAKVYLEQFSAIMEEE